MLLTSLIIGKISVQITKPIIELTDKIKLIIQSHQKEKDIYIKSYQNKDSIVGSR